MDEAPWLNAEQRGLAALLLSSHQRAFKRPLIAAARPGQSIRLRCQELFSSGIGVHQHRVGAVAVGQHWKAAALQLWGRTWADMVGMPSRLTAPDEVRSERRQALQMAQRQEAIRRYGGVRIDRAGRRFMIRNARIWTLWDEEQRSCGQAACFSDWWWL